MIINLKFITYDHFRCTPMLTREVPIDQGTSEIRFYSLQLVHGIETRLKAKYVES